MAKGKNDNADKSDKLKGAQDELGNGGSGQGNGNSDRPPDPGEPRQHWSLSARAAVVSTVVVLTGVVALVGAVLEALDLPTKYPEDDFLVPKEVILSGSESALADLHLDGYFERLSVIPIGEIAAAATCEGLSDSPGQGRDQVIARYKVKRRTFNTRRALGLIEQALAGLDEVTDRADLIRLEPNWVVGNPWEIEGSPWEIEGGFWKKESGASSSSTPMTQDPDPDKAAEHFMEQWALSNIAYDRVTEEFISTSPVNPVRVGVFDTSPFTMPVSAPAQRSVPWVTKPSILNLTLDPSIAARPEEEIDFLNHGLFVAGLAHAIAPRSDIELVRVLDADNKGDLFTLIDELYQFIVGVDDETAAVINLSLGLRLLPDAAAGYKGVSRQVDALRYVLALAECSGIVVVAAAGNTSADILPPNDAMLPAAWDDVISVAASDKEGHRSCYSNKGDVAAPGGNGGPSDNKKEPSNCVPKTCEDEQCPYAVLGPVMKPDSSPDGYAYWAGSSFATPLVSGLAARILEKGGPNMPPDLVREIIECSTRNSPKDPNITHGVINVTEALDYCYQLHAPKPAE